MLVPRRVSGGQLTEILQTLQGGCWLDQTSFHAVCQNATSFGLAKVHHLVRMIRIFLQF
jgi:hypothetical protein